MLLNTWLRHFLQPPTIMPLCKQKIKPCSLFWPQTRGLDRDLRAGEGLNPGSCVFPRIAPATFSIAAIGFAAFPLVLSFLLSSCKFLFHRSSNHIIESLVIKYQDVLTFRRALTSLPNLLGSRSSLDCWFVTIRNSTFHKTHSLDRPTRCFHPRPCLVHQGHVTWSGYSVPLCFVVPFLQLS